MGASRILGSFMNSHVDLFVVQHLHILDDGETGLPLSAFPA